MATTLLLFDSTGAPIPASDSDIVSGGILSCSALTQEFPAGVSYVGVQDNGDNSTIGTYRLQATILGNAGNESEPNDSIAAATEIVGNNVVISGDHEVEADSDFYKITVPSGASVRAEIIEGNGNLVETCAGFAMDSRLTLLPASGPFLAEDDDSGRGGCSMIDGTGSPPIANTVGSGDLGASALTGTYYLQVRSFSPSVNTNNRFDYRLALIMH